MQNSIKTASEIYKTDQTLIHAQLYAKLTHLWQEEKDEVETETNLKAMLKYVNSVKDVVD
jgi:hypothetical protein